MSLSKEEVRQSLLEYLERRGVRPGCLLSAKAGASLKMFVGQLEDLENSINKIYGAELDVSFLTPGTILLFVNAHGLRVNLDLYDVWDFWFEFLMGETTIFVHSGDFGDWKLKNEFEIKYAT